VSSAKKPSTAFSHEQDIGVKWKVQRGWRSSQARAPGTYWVVAQDDMDTLRAGMSRSSAFRKRMNS
jgi:hypothetical protein